jgi:hypothetical protein
LSLTGDPSSHQNDDGYHFAPPILRPTYILARLEFVYRIAHRATAHSAECKAAQEYCSPAKTPVSAEWNDGYRFAVLVAAPSFQNSERPCVIGMQERSAALLIGKLRVNSKSRPNRVRIARSFRKTDTKGGRKFLSCYTPNMDITVQAGARLVVGLHHQCIIWLVRHSHVPTYRSGAFGR